MPFQKIDHFTFLIADQLQLYNHSVTRSASEVLSSSAITSCKVEREQWIDRIMGKLRRTRGGDEASLQFDVISMEKILDAAFFRVYRGLRLLFSTDANFKRDVLDSARNHALSHTQSNSVETRISLSVDYIIEEIATNVRIRLGNRFQMEFYPGDYQAPLIRLYDGRYEATHFELMGLPVSSEIYHFFSYDDSLRAWKEISNNRCSGEDQIYL